MIKAYAIASGTWRSVSFVWSASRLLRLIISVVI